MWKVGFFILLGLLLATSITLGVITYKTYRKSQLFMKAFYVKPAPYYSRLNYDPLPESNYLVQDMSLDFNPITLKLCIDILYRGYDYYFHNPGANSEKIKDVYAFMKPTQVYYQGEANTVIIVQPVGTFRRVWIMNRGVGNKEEMINLLTNFYTNDMNMTSKPTAIKGTTTKGVKRLATMIDVLEGETESVFEGIQSRAIDIYNRESVNVINKFIEEYTPNSNDQIIVFGHSFGGSLTLVIYRRLLELFKDNMACYTFNSIKVGNRIFRKSIPTDRVFRIFNTEDIVPGLPFASFYNWNTDKYENYYHVGKNYTFSDNSGSATFNHSMDIIKLNQDKLVFVPDETLLE